MFSSLEVIFLGAVLLSMSYFTLRFVLDKPKVLQYYALVVNMPLYVVTHISVVLMLLMPFSSGYLLIVGIFKIMIIFLLFAEVMLQAISIFIARNERKKEVHTIQLT